ncbi:MAG TPA: hypothetical protein PK096_00590 [Candidatus Saccharibacteria bacterium]|nr:hypothetical protein [Candidatus Saccharibacteria bacterium]HRK93851.1 hypothetical protein [Candidatus Saccharibacteria bacterium]
MKQFFLLLATRLRIVLASSSFFWLTVGLFSLGAIWVATASLYPMAFDEDFHMGLIKIYATSWLPYGIEHTRDMSVYGSATADPSYLFHYLMSFPYRLLEFLAVPFDTIVVLLRLLNIGMFVGAMVVFRKALISAGISRLITHVSLALFSLIPIAPVLAGQVNYDNLALLFVALSLLLTIRITNSLRETGTVPAAAFWLVVIVILFGMPTKYAFIPIAAALVLWLVFTLLKTRRKIPFKQHARRLITDTHALSTKSRLFLAAGLIAGTFFSAHYVTNFVQYGSPIPSCEKVFDTQACLAYGPWRRDFRLEAERPASFVPLPFAGYLTRYWVPDMGFRLTFAVAGPTNGYQTKKPLSFLYPMLMVVGSIGVVVLLAMAWRLRDQPLVWILLLASLLYLGTLAVKLYGSYVATTQPVAINGRYLLPLLPIAAAVIMYAIQRLFQRRNLQVVGPIVAAIAIIVVLITGGGIGTYVIQAEPHWFFPGWGQDSHQFLQTIFSLFVIK